ncbi:MAG: endo-1,4-beta-xylanase [Verrucomicrobiota bacterium]
MMKRFMTLPAVWLTLSLCASLQAAPPTRPLKETYRGYFDIGCAVPSLPGSFKETELALLREQFNSLTAENCMKPAPTEPRENEFRFAAGDSLAAFARSNNMKLVGHCLVWHEQCPDWMFQDGNQPAKRELVLQRMKNHIQTLVKHYQGQVVGWDVVNEAIDEHQPNGLRRSKWLSTVGEDFVEKAFQYAREADPNVQLYYNDFDIESPGKRKQVLKLITRLKAAGCRLDAVGIQGHYALDRVPLRNLEASIEEFYQAGVKVMITELDMDVLGRRNSGADLAMTEKAKPGAKPQAAICPPEILKQQADQYAELFRLLAKHRDKVTRVTFWGLHDGRSWLNTYPIQGRINHAMLFDRQCQPKPAFFSVSEALTRTSGAR